MLETASARRLHMLQIGRVYYEYKTALDICERASKHDAAFKKQKDEMNL